MLGYLQSTNPPIAQTVDLQGLVTAWKENLTLRVQADEIKQDTATSYTRGAVKFMTWLGDKKPSADVIRAWKADLLKNKIKPASVNAWLAGLRSFFGWLAERGEISFDPTQAIKGAKRRGVSKSHVRELLTDREAIRLLAQPKRDTPEGARDYAILCVMLYTAPT